MSTRVCWDCEEEKPLEDSQFRLLYEGKRGPVFRGRCRKCENRHRVGTPDKAQRTRNYKSKATERLWLQTVEAYGGKCTCCGESCSEFLVIDHVNDDGAEHRRRQRPGNPKSWSGKALYTWLRQNGWPSGFQLLCANCNMAKTRKGGCPHGRLS